MPPLALTQAKYAAAMFAMSVKEVPASLVTMPPSAIGVPVAVTPGFVPHCEVAVAAALWLAAGLLVLPVLVGELAHPASTAIPITATSARCPRTFEVCLYICICLHLLVARHKPARIGRGEPILERCLHRRK